MTERNEVYRVKRSHKTSVNQWQMFPKKQGSIGIPIKDVVTTKPDKVEKPDAKLTKPVVSKGTEEQLCETIWQHRKWQSVEASESF